MVTATGLAADCGLCQWRRVGARDRVPRPGGASHSAFPNERLWDWLRAGAIAALTGLYKRATERESWWGGVSLVGYDVYLLSLGLYPPEVVDDLKSRFRDAGFFGKDAGGLRYSDSVDEVGKRALKAMKQVRPELFNERNFDEAWSHGFGAKVKYAKSAVDIAGISIVFLRGTRPNGTDKAGWDGWEIEMG